MEMGSETEAVRPGKMDGASYEETSSVCSTAARKQHGRW